MTILRRAVGNARGHVPASWLGHCDAAEKARAGLLAAPVSGTVSRSEPLGLVWGVSSMTSPQWVASQDGTAAEAGRPLLRETVFMRSHSAGPGGDQAKELTVPGTPSRGSAHHEGVTSDSLTAAWGWREAAARLPCTHVPTPPAALHSAPGWGSTRLSHGSRASLVTQALLERQLGQQHGRDQAWTRGRASVPQGPHRHSVLNAGRTPASGALALGPGTLPRAPARLWLPGSESQGTRGQGRLAGWASCPGPVTPQWPEPA